MTKVVKLIYSDEFFGGMGTEEDPCYRIERLYTLEGYPVAERKMVSDTAVGEFQGLPWRKP